MTAKALSWVDARGWVFTYEVHAGSRPAFHAIYDGEQRGLAQRGFAAVLSQGIENGSNTLQAAAWAAHGFAEGYFGAATTLSPTRAAGKALEAINSWLFGYGSSRQQNPGLHVCFAAMLMAGRRVGFVSVGRCTIYLWRQGTLLPLNDEGEPSSNPTAATAPLGALRDVFVDYLDVEARPGDCYVLAIGTIARLDVEAVCRGEGMPAEAKAVLLRINLEQIPLLRLSDLKADFGNLPLRDPPQEGETLDGFVIGRTIYRSRYTLLRRARDTIDNRDVLLKFPLRAMLQDQVFQAGFLREAWVGRTVSSKWVAEYLTLAPGRQSCLYMALPFYRGETLEERLSRQPPVGFAEGMSIALRLCEAVDDLNRLQMIHRDLKPENIVLPNEGGLRLLDLGLAYLPGIDDPAEERLGGTTRYMAPELFHGSPPDPRSEVFSLGVTIYRMFSGGHFPFGQWEKQPLSRKRPDLPAWLGKCVRQAFATDPALRFADAVSFAQALEAGLKNGDPRPLLRPSWRLHTGNLRFWQMLTAIFATAFIVTLFLLHRRWP
jgi:hypothetical protein